MGVAPSLVIPAGRLTAAPLGPPRLKPSGLVPAASFVGLGGKAQVVRLDAQELGRLDAESLQDLDGGLDLVVRTLHVQRLGKVFLGLGRQDPRAVSMRSEIIVSPPVVKRFAG